MKNSISRMPFIILVSLILLIFGVSTHGQPDKYPHPEHNPESSLMLDGDWVPSNTHEIDFNSLPVISSEHAIVSDVRYAWGRKVNQHNYLVYYRGLFWMMWSDGPGVPGKAQLDDPVKSRGMVPHHDQPGQLISYATSKDGINWSEPRDLAGPPDDGFGWIARGFWVREGRLLALATRYNAPDYRGKGLQLHAYEYNRGKKKDWQYLGLVADNTMNNFPPKKLPNGEWMMSRRDSVGNVFMISGGIKSIDDWMSFPIATDNHKELLPEEPYWLVLPDNNLVAFFRDNGGSGFLYRAFSTNNGRTWSRPVRTNFPDAKSKFSGLRLLDGRYVLVSNANPRKRDPLTIAVSKDGLVFDKMAILVGSRHVDYPHVMEYMGYLYIAFSGAKQTVEVLRVPISELETLKMPKIKPNGY